MDDETFKKLEILSIGIDIWIDEEKYDEVNNAFKLSQDINLIDLFRSPHGTHKKEDNGKWNSILFDIGDQPPVIEADGTPLTDTSDPVVGIWSRLLYAKLIRARIQKMGTDCYLKRLDDVITFLERHLPNATTSEIQVSKLALFYLFELSASSQEYDMLGFSRRAKQILLRQHHLMSEESHWFYDLLAHYNYGVAYFHMGEYRLAVREFNYVIKNVLELAKAENSNKKEFFNIYGGEQFLYLPSVLYRADIQIKLQLAYHSLDTLERYFEKYNSGKVSPHKKIRAELIRTEAYQQMYDAKRSWEHLDKAFKYISELEHFTESLGQRTNFTKLPDRFASRQFLQGVKSRFVDIFVEDYLTWLETVFGHVKEANEGDSLSPIIENRYESANLCSIMLQSTFTDIYFSAVRHHTNNRNGYYQQLVQFLAWLTKKYTRKEERLSEDKDGDLVPELCKRAIELYEANRNELMLEELRRKEVECYDCDWQGIDLERLETEHYKWFTDAMFEFYENLHEYLTNDLSRSIEMEKMRQELIADRESLIKRLLRIERINKEDLRITDLNLRYKSDLVLDSLVAGHNGRDLCLRGSLWDPSDFNEAFTNLLACVPSDQNKDGLMDSEQYLQIIKGWWDHYTHHLKYRSTHQRHMDGVYFISLQRWNSSSPAQGRSVGGGYLLYKTDKYGVVDLGVAIDPGFDFLRNLFHTGFSLDDIDIILISHAHADHIRDFESIAIMLNELNKRDGKKKKIHVILTLGAYKRLEHIIEDPTFRFFIEPYIIDVHKEIDPNYFERLSDYNFSFEKEPLDGSSSYRKLARYRPLAEPSRNATDYPTISICPTRAYHDDSSTYSDSFGFLIKVKVQVNSSHIDEVTLGYTGDTKWVYPTIVDPSNNKRKIEDISTQYRNCETFVVHLGSLIEKPFSQYNQCNNVSSIDDCEKLVREKNHPYLVGMLRLLSSSYRNHKRNNQIKQLILVGEFGEELRGGIRRDLIARFEKAYGKCLSFLPLDVGMDIQLWPRLDLKDTRNPTKQKVWCVQCEDFVRIEDAEFERYGVDEALYCVCKTCRNATPINVLQDRLRQLYEVGYELRTHENR